MTVSELQSLISQRDDELGINGNRWDYAHERAALNRLMEDKPVLFFDGSRMEIEERVSTYQAGYRGEFAEDDGWGSNAEGEFVIVKHIKTDGTEDYYEVQCWYDSWDNGDPDIWQIKEIKQVKPVVKRAWESV